MTEYVIVGDTIEFEDCLVYVCGTKKSTAETVLERMLKEPEESEKKYSNLKIKEVAEKDQWWNDPFLAN